ncbi:MAG: DUF2851 domain-containing protein [Flavobacteriales bacterium CG_4_8_14_3_um_filter_35_10]|nr:MAG: hypothetical protein COV50_01045 [Flavobacteriales bacterium CG11_big_fil_rev_8_21_14_0_20_35_7]PIX07986.1 MAG: DUF2851 domain-containing protein [Flavobacteriales bacterium CG_4_8_14_3_um_filter_35_10]PJA06434.1 MAG: DUF2851 domain-containing protein [Flavobacteriales bacterium CG_4_10_14_0_2_um_filter_35_18]
MKEDFLHYIWKLQLLKSENLVDSDKEPLLIHYQGAQNFNSGPDFFNAKIAIDGQVWVGNIEIHVKSSDWYVHHHELDANYDSVILHVVWEHDMPVFRKGNDTIPTLVLKDFVSDEIIANYFKLINNARAWINCEKQIGQVDKFVLNNWLERLYVERLEQKSLLINELLLQTNNDWEAVFFMLLTKNFGLKVNGSAFFNLAKAIDFKVVRKIRPNLLDLEALFFGEAQLLSKHEEVPYYLELQKVYNYLKSKYNLNSKFEGSIQFFRLRPDNFPTIRLAQLAALYHQNETLFSKIITLKSVEALYNFFNIETSSFWKNHYTFQSETSSIRHKKLSKNFVDLLIINTLMPLKFIYFKKQGKAIGEDLIRLVHQIKPEKNGVITQFALLKIKADSAFHSQALLQLKNDYCTPKRCLQCQIGYQLLKNNPNNNAKSN